jgi:hypothetical protein
MAPESQPMTVHEFNDATSGFYELPHGGIALHSTEWSCWKSRMSCWATCEPS